MREALNIDDGPRLHIVQSLRGRIRGLDQRIVQILGETQTPEAEHSRYHLRRLAMEIKSALEAHPADYAVPGMFQVTNLYCLANEMADKIEAKHGLRQKMLPEILRELTALPDKG
jgi:hypothetical protein